MPILNRVRVTLTGVAGAPAYMNLYTTISGASAATAHAAAVAFVTGLKTVQTSALFSNIEGDVAQIDTFNDNVVGVVTVPPVTIQASGTGNQLPQANQILVRWLTGSYAGGRQVRGRTFIPYLITTTQSAGGKVAAATITTVNGAVNSYIAGLPSGTAVVYSRKNQNAYPVNAYSVWSDYATLRSRRD